MRIFAGLIKGIWGTCLFTSRDMEYWYKIPIQAKEALIVILASILYSRLD